jgi:prephenate dehydratase
MRVAFQGELGAFSEEAIARLWGSAAEAVPRREFLDVAMAVERGEVECGLLPVENSLAGSVVGSYDALAACTTLHVVAEVVLPIHHCLLGVRGASIADLRSVESHPVALAQCGEFLRRHPALEVRMAYDTAGAAREVAARGERSLAAIAGRAASARYALDLLATDIEDRPDNQTRFLAIAREPARLAAGAPARTAVLLTTANVPGALLGVLMPLAEQGMNLSKLESRPALEPWSYRFFLEMEHAADDPAAAAAIAEIGRRARSLRVLGTFSRWAAHPPAEEGRSNSNRE